MMRGEMEQLAADLATLTHANLAAAEKDDDSFAAAIAFEWGEMKDAFEDKVREAEARRDAVVKEHAHHSRAVRDTAVVEILALRAKIEATSQVVANAPRVGFEAGPGVPSTPRRPMSVRPGSAMPSRPGTAMSTRPESRLNR